MGETYVKRAWRRKGDDVLCGQAHDAADKATPHGGAQDRLHERAILVAAGAGDCSGTKTNPLHSLTLTATFEGTFNRSGVHYRASAAKRVSNHLPARFNLSRLAGIQWQNLMTHVERVAAPMDFVVTEAPDDEPDRIRRAQQRDMHAFEQLYRAHVGRVHAVCLRMTANLTRAEELTQKAFVTVWEKLPFFRGESAFTSWLHRVAVNTVLAEFRAEHRRTRHVFATEDPSVFETPITPAPAGIRLDIEQAVAVLPPQARIVFVLHDIEGWRHDEIARQLGVATGTSKAQLHRARRLLQEALQ